MDTVRYDIHQTMKKTARLGDPARHRPPTLRHRRLISDLKGDLVVDTLDTDQQVSNRLFKHQNRPFLIES